jgi:hypothetical protein
LTSKLPSINKLYISRVSTGSTGSFYWLLPGDPWGPGRCRSWRTSRWATACPPWRSRTARTRRCPKSFRAQQPFGARQLVIPGLAMAWENYPLAIETNGLLWKITILFMGKSTINDHFQ